MSGSSALIFFHSSSVKSSLVASQAATSELIIAAAQTIILKRMFFLPSFKLGCKHQNASTIELVATSLSNAVMPPYSSLCRYSAFTTMCGLTTTRTPAVKRACFVR